MKKHALVPWLSRASAPATGYHRAPVYSLHSDMNNMLNKFFNDFIEPAAATELETVSRFSPCIDVEEFEDKFVVSAEVPGATEDDFDISLSDGLLTLKGEKKAEYEKSEGKAHYRGRAFGSFSQSIPFQVALDEDNVDAAMKNGILTITLPKAEESRESVRKVSVRHES